MKTSAGILLYRKTMKELEFFLIHPGGPFWKNKEHGAWSIPKGEFTDEEPLAAAQRELEEETGHCVDGNFIALTPIQQKGGKLVYAFAIEGNVDANNIKSNLFTQEWPYKSGKWQSFPEVDKAGWFGIDEAKRLINSSQAGLIDEVIDLLQKNSKLD